MRDQGDGRGHFDETPGQAYARPFTEEGKLRMSKHSQNVTAHLNRVHITGNERAANRRLED